MRPADCPEKCFTSEVMCNAVKGRKMSIGFLSKVKLHVIAAGCIAVIAIFHSAPARTLQNINSAWKFNYSDVSGAAVTTYNDAGWSTVYLPHTFKYHNYHDGLSRGIGWYRRHFTIAAADSTKKVFLEFQGAMTVAQVYVNGSLLNCTQSNYGPTDTTHYGGFLPFTLDITGKVVFGGDNVVAVRLDNNTKPDVPPEKIEDPNFDYYLFGGLYRDVNLITTDKLYIPDPLSGATSPGGGTFITTPTVSTSSATVVVKTVVKNEYAAAKSCVLMTTLTDQNGATVGSAQQTTQSVAAGGTSTFTQTFTIASPSLWSLTSPALYSATAEVYDNTTLVDSYTSRFGVRSIKFDKTNGFSLNGSVVKLLGVNRHQMMPYVGGAVGSHAQYREAKLLKDMGCNFIRLSHYPQDPHFMDALDELGIMCWVELPGWGGWSKDAVFQARSVWNVRDMIRRDRNHPSVIIWGCGINECDQEPTFETNLQAQAKSEDTTRKTTMARQYEVNSNVFDVYGLNCFTPPLPSSCSDPNALGMINSEHTGHTYPTHRYDAEATLIEHARRHAAMNTEQRTRNWVAGGTGWCAFDYNSSFNSENNIAYHGVSDLFRIPKFAYYFYRSQSAGDNYDGSKHPMVFIESFSNYTMPSTQTLVVYSNCDQVQLYVNGTSVATKSPDAGTSLAHPPFTFSNVSYASPGTLRADGLIGGVVKATQTVYRPGTASKILLQSDTDTLMADGEDFARVVVSIADNNNMVLHSASNAVTVSASGAGKVICGSAGPVASGSVTVEGGALAFLVQAGTAAGTITVTATSGSLTQAQAIITVVAPTVGVKESGNNLATKGHFVMTAIKSEGKNIVFENLNRNVPSQIMLVSLTGKVVQNVQVTGRSSYVMKTEVASCGVYVAICKNGINSVRKNITVLK
jgi:beta-galactosidase/beta-glucuronidase